MATVASIGPRGSRRFAAASPAYELYVPSGHRLRKCATIVLGALAMLAAAIRSHAVLIQFPDFTNTTALTINGNATVTTTGDGKVMRVAPAGGNQVGSFFLTNQVNVGGFSTAFTFRMSAKSGITDGFSNGADGITFVLQTVGATAIGNAGSGIGYENIGARSVAVEFDTFKNGGAVNDPSTNHLGINTGGSVTSLVTANVSPDFDNNTLWTAWIDYNGTTLEVRVSNNSTRPSAATLTSNLNLLQSTLLNSTTAFVGFTSATGGAHANHDIVGWAFQDSYSASGISVPTAVPEPGTTALLVVGVGLLLGYTRIRARGRDRA